MRYRDKSEIEEMRELGKQVRLYRAEHKLKQREFAEKCYVNQRFISYIESEMWGNVSKENLETFKVVFGMLKKVGEDGRATPENRSGLVQAS